MSGFRRAVVVGLVLVSVGAPALAFAHTEPSLVAVPAGQQATVALQPTHGCGDSPTVEVAIRVPVAGAVPLEVEGWTAQATPDGNRTVLEWTGGSLPPTEAGAFPAQFVAPNSVGELLLFPSVQVCENGEELTWIDGDPEGEYPAPRLLVLPPDGEAAVTIDDVPPDAPGREQLLVEIADVDNPTGTTAPPTTNRPSTTTTEKERTTTTERERTTTSTTEAPPADDTDAGADEDEGNDVVWLVVAVLVAVGIGFIVMLLMRRRPDRS